MAEPERWTTSWYAAPCRMPEAGLKGRTFRQIVHLHASGQKLRLRLSNRYGDHPVTLTDISVGRALQGPVVADGVCPVTFNQQAAVTLPPGEDVTSDPVQMTVDSFTNMAISFRLADGECLTGHMSAQQISYVSNKGDVGSATGEIAYLVFPLQTSSWWLIAGVDVVPDVPVNTLVIFGSSTTDGMGSSVNANRRWPNYLARRLQNAGADKFMSVVNAGISGNQLTGSNMPQLAGPAIPTFLLGEPGQRRLAWDVSTQSGATDLIFHIGSNDLRCGMTAEAIIKAYQDMTTEARKRLRRVFGTTILPGGYTPAQAAQRQIVNEWMIQHGREYFDAVFDLGAALEWPSNRDRMDPLYDSGDGIHPNDEGYRVMAEAIDITQLSGSPGVSKDVVKVA
ncbi:SGNH hydrolase-type esterase domain-containing protein [Aspergillus avenaceus]|uniref:SGNH hydrolase-type esterase domain-containing protein n=1 Tax=Aspergillus avenaceus TaxID=36643 RepID=A0A5N6U9P3_ASPAV|nr:SGNH hydrolase-type esterase domain-containing protein [Aspergillus avenaceus]